MYEQYFREFVECLFPNDLLDIAILDFVEGKGTLEEAREFGEKHKVNLFSDEDRVEFVINLSRILTEMRKDKTQHPKKDLIDYYLWNILALLKSTNAPNIDKHVSFHEFMRDKKGEVIMPFAENL